MAAIFQCIFLHVYLASASAAALCPAACCGGCYCSWWRSGNIRAQDLMYWTTLREDSTCIAYNLLILLKHEKSWSNCSISPTQVHLYSFYSSHIAMIFSSKHTLISTTHWMFTFVSFYGFLQILLVFFIGFYYGFHIFSMVFLVFFLFFVHVFICGFL